MKIYLIREEVTIGDVKNCHIVAAEIDKATAMGHARSLCEATRTWWMPEDAPEVVRDDEHSLWSVGNYVYRVIEYDLPDELNTSIY